MVIAVARVGMLCFSTKARLMVLLVPPLYIRAANFLRARLLGISIGMSVVRALSLTLSWQITTVPREIEGAKPTAHLILDSRYVDGASFQAIEDLLYGTDGTDSALPDPEDIIAMLTE